MHDEPTNSQFDSETSSVPVHKSALHHELETRRNPTPLFQGQLIADLWLDILGRLAIEVQWYFKTTLLLKFKLPFRAFGWHNFTRGLQASQCFPGRTLADDQGSHPLTGSGSRRLTVGILGTFPRLKGG